MHIESLAFYMLLVRLLPIQGNGLTLWRRIHPFPLNWDNPLVLYSIFMPPAFCSFGATTR